MTAGSVYQEYLAKTLTDKYANLNVQMDKIINDANSELEVLNQKLSSTSRTVRQRILLSPDSVMQMDQDKLKADNTNLVAAFREKNRKHQQTQELYDRLKRKEMLAQTQSAAYESVDEVLGSVSRRRSKDPLAPIEPYQSIPRHQEQRDPHHFPVDRNGVEQLHTHQRSGSNGSRNSEGRMPPPPPPPFRRPAEYGSQAVSDGESHTNESNYLPNIFSVTSMPPPQTQHRARLGPMSNSGNRLGVDGHRNVNGFMGSSQMQTPSHRQPFASMTSNSVNRSSVSGYGMSAGLKVGRQIGGGRYTVFWYCFSTLLTLIQLLALEVTLILFKAATAVAS